MPKYTTKLYVPFFGEVSRRMITCKSGETRTYIRFQTILKKSKGSRRFSRKCHTRITYNVSQCSRFRHLQCIYNAHQLYLLIFSYYKRYNAQAFVRNIIIFILKINIILIVRRKQQKVYAVFLHFFLYFLQLTLKNARFRKRMYVSVCVRLFQ